MTCAIRRAESIDFPTLRTLCLAEGWRSYVREDYRNALEASVVYVACRDERLVGFARALTDGVFSIFLAELLVVPDCRGQGIGQALVEALHTAYPTARMDLLSDADGFYEKLGFRKLGSGFRNVW